MIDLHWSPEQFWKATPHEFHAALEINLERTKEGQKRAREREFAARAASIRKGMKERNG